MRDTYKIGDLCNVEKGKTPISKAVPGKYPLVTTAEIHKSSNDYQFENPAVLIPLVSSTGHGHASIKRLHYQEGKYALGTILCAVTPKDASILDTKFLYIFLSLYKDKLIVPLMKGAANVSLTIKNIQEIEIPLGTIDFQRSVVIKFNQIKNIQEILNNDNEKQINTLGTLENSLLNDAISGALTHNPQSENNQVGKKGIPFSIPSSWEWVSFDKYFDIQGGSQPPKSKFRYEPHTGYVRLFQIRDFGENPIPVYVPENTVTKFCTKDDIMIGRYGASVGKVFYGQAGAYNVALVKLIYNKEFFNKDYLYFLFNAPYIQNIFQRMQRSAQAGFNKSDLSSVLIPKPSIEEQLALSSQLLQVKDIINSLKQCFEKKSSLLELLPQVLVETTEKIIKVDASH